MAPTTRLAKSLTRLLFPAALLLLLALVGGSVWLVYSAARPFKTRYLVTPATYGQLSTRAAQVTDESWQNKDGSSSRAWLLRGAENAPAVILLHRYGADRSHVLDLGVKMNEATNFTILMPDLRGHGENPAVKNASFGGCESEDLESALQFLRSLRAPNQTALVGKKIGVYGVEMGALVAVWSAFNDDSIKAVALDSVPEDSDGVLKESIEKRFPFASQATSKLAAVGTRIYYFDGCYRHEPVCDTARKLENRDVMLLAGVDASEFQDSTAKLSKCFASSSRVQSKTDLSPSGFGINRASIEQTEIYQQRLIGFFRDSLSE